MNRNMPILLAVLAFLAGCSDSCEKKNPPASVRSSGAFWHAAHTIDLPSRVGAVVPRRNGTIIVGLSRDNTYLLYDWKTGKQVGTFTSEPIPPPGYAAYPHDNRALALTPDESQLLVADYQSRSVSIIEMRDPKNTASVPCGDPPYRFQSVTSERCIALTDRSVHVIDLKTISGKEEPTWNDMIRDPQRETTYGLHYDGALTLTIEQGQAKKVVSLGKLDRHDGSVLALSPNGKRLYVLVVGHRLMALNVLSGECEKTIDLPPAPSFHGMVLSPNGAWIALWAPEKGVSEDRLRAEGQIRLLDANSLADISIDAEKITSPRSLCFTPDNKFILVPDNARIVIFGAPTS